jgi:8-oxo-dGTP diphosphatase
MIKVSFYDSAEDDLLEFAVIVARYQDKWVYCKHKNRNTYEVAGGHRDKNKDGDWAESVEMAARRELYEETGALTYELIPVCIYSVLGNDNVIQNKEETYGMLYFAEISEFGELPDSEMEKVLLLEEYPTKWTYPLIQPKLIERIETFLSTRN